MSCRDPVWSPRSRVSGVANVDAIRKFLRFISLKMFCGSSGRPGGNQRSEFSNDDTTKQTPMSTKVIDVRWGGPLVRAGPPGPALRQRNQLDLAPCKPARGTRADQIQRHAYSNTIDFMAI